MKQPVGTAARLLGWTPPPETASSAVRRHNYLSVQLESAAMGVANAAGIFLPVFLVRLGATNLEISLLTAIPALAGFLFSIPLGAYIQQRRNVVPWYSRSRGASQLVYAATAVAVVLVPPAEAVVIVLVLWAFMTIPSTIGMVAFYAVMDGAAGPRGRYDLLSMRWSVMGLTTAITVAVAGQLLEWVAFPLNYQIVFVVFSVAGVVAAYYANRIRLPDHPPVTREPGASVRSRLRSFADLLNRHRPFQAFVLRHFVFTLGTRLAVPLIPLWYVREAGASDAWVGIIGMSQSLILLFGYNFWRRQSRRRSTRSLVIATTIGAALYPVVLSLSTDLIAIVFITAYGAAVYAGIDLVLFDLLMRSIPQRHAVTLTSVETSVQNLASIIGPLLGGVIADLFGIAAGLVVAGVVTLAGALMFVVARPPATTAATPPPEPPPPSPEPTPPPPELPAPSPGPSGSQNPESEPAGG
ncbi:MAG: MFS transporter [Chloroflexi bacterium]|nr:MFS transporter [Chloroflexota bacterium]